MTEQGGEQPVKRSNLHLVTSELPVTVQASEEARIVFRALLGEFPNNDEFVEAMQRIVQNHHNPTPSEEISIEND